MVILNAHILNKLYGSEKLKHDAFRDRLIKFLIGEGLKSYNIPLPPVINRKIGKYNEIEFQEKRLHERHFPTSIPAAEGRKRKRPTQPCFVCNKLPVQEIEIPIQKNSFWCEDCGKPLCITPCFQIYHTKLDFKKDATNFRLHALAIPLDQSP